MGSGGDEPKELFGQAFGRRPDAAKDPSVDFLRNLTHLSH